MSQRSAYLGGMPCWVETMQPDPRAAMEFYGPLFGWKFRKSDGESDIQEGEHFTATLDGRAVAGIRSVPASDEQPIPPMWSTSIHTADIGETIDAAVRVGGSLLLGPLTVPGGRWAMLMDPTGAAVGVLQTKGKGGAELVNKPGTWMMSSLHTPETSVAGEFYRDIFGWEPELSRPGSTVSLLRLPGYVGGDPSQGLPQDVVAVMTKIDGGRDAITTPPHWGVNFRVADTESSADRTRDLGGQVLMPPTTTPEFINAVFMDSQGAVFSVSQVLPPVK